MVACAAGMRIFCVAWLNTSGSQVLDSTMLHPALQVARTEALDMVYDMSRKQMVIHF